MTSSTTSAYHIPVNNERSNRIMNSSTRNTPRMIMSDTTTTPPPPSNNNNSNNNNNLVNTVMNDSSMRVGTPGSSGYGSGNELTTGNSTQSTSPIGSTPRIFGNCAECSLRIVNLTDACYAMGYLYHNSCFVCCCCSKCCDYFSNS
ncbi:unnamed protein product [Trichobilharzia regenti]|nr:unnamed protein product [Trichobilharzia regenti]